MKDIRCHNLALPYILGLGILTACSNSQIGVIGSDKKDITFFSIPSALNASAGLNENCSAVISGQNLEITVPYGTPVTSLVAIFVTTGASVGVDQIQQTSGRTINDFTNPKTYSVKAFDGTVASYTVTVTEALVSVKPEPSYFYVEAGHSYDVVFSADMDTASIGKTWTSQDWSGSPLAYMMRTPFIIKADDFGGMFSPSTQRFLDEVSEVHGVAGLGIITGALSNIRDESTIDSYKNLSQQGFELWFHGQTHLIISPTDTEFLGASLASQEYSFEQGTTIGKSILGVDFHTFGAPGNVADSNTVIALNTYPQFVVWLFGDGAPDPKLMVLLWNPGIEYAVGRVESDSIFKTTLDTLPLNPSRPIIVQIHPYVWLELDHQNFVEILKDIVGRGSLRFTCPYDWWQYENNLGKVTLTKIGPQSYTLDMTRATTGMRLQVDPNGPLPTGIVLLQ